MSLELILGEADGLGPLRHEKPRLVGVVGRGRVQGGRADLVDALGSKHARPVPTDEHDQRVAAVGGGRAVLLGRPPDRTEGVGRAVDRQIHGPAPDAVDLPPFGIQAPEAGLQRHDRRAQAVLGNRPNILAVDGDRPVLDIVEAEQKSRNRRFGLALGQGKDVDTAQEEIGQVVEGYRNTKEVWLLSERMGVEMPIVEQIYQVLYQGKDARMAAQDLLARDKKSEA